MCKRGLPCSGQVYPAVIIAGYTGQANDILQFIIQSGIINFDDVQNSMEAMKRKELLEKHPYKIWKGKDIKRHMSNNKCLKYKITNLIEDGDECEDY